MRGSEMKVLDSEPSPFSLYRVHLDSYLIGRDVQARLSFSHKIPQILSSDASPSEIYFLHLDAHRMDEAKTFERLISLERVKVRLLPHQLSAAYAVLNQLKHRGILADEVGLGKTIEAGIVIKEYLLRGMARKILILVPAPLQKQWQVEMYTKFGEYFEINREVSGWSKHDRIISSLELARSPRHRVEILNQMWDLVVLDEAHKVKNPSSVAYRFVSRIPKRYFLALTATPVQNDIMELYHLVNLVKPGLLGSPSSFRSRFLTTKGVLRDPEGLRRVLREVMIRQRRSDALIRFTDRIVKTVGITLTPAERGFYRALLDYTRRTFNPERTLVYVTLQKMAASSPPSAIPLLEKMKAPSDLIRMANSVDLPSKTRTLVRILKEADEKVLVFTSYRRTLDHVYGILRSEGLDVDVFHGGMSLKDKDRAVERFKKEGRVLLATDAGGEGMNFQFARILINYDLPWNPMKLEQRIGRVHRLTQSRDVIIINLVARKTIEERVLDLLYKKVDLFNVVVGEMDMIISNMETGRNLEAEILRAIAESKDEEDLEERLRDLSKDLSKAKRMYSMMKTFDERVFENFDLTPYKQVME